MSATHPASDLIPYLRGELNRRERERTAAHLDGCAPCRTEAEVLARTLRLVAAQVAQLPAPEWTVYRTELRRKLTARATRPARWWQPTLVWGGLATAAVALLTIVAIHRGDQGTQPPVELEKLALADAPDIGLLRNYPMVERMDMLDDDNYDVIAHLDELAPPSQTHEIEHL